LTGAGLGLAEGECALEFCAGARDIPAAMAANKHTILYFVMLQSPAIPHRGLPLLDHVSGLDAAGTVIRTRLLLRRVLALPGEAGRVPGVTARHCIGVSVRVSSALCKNVEW
jgi:hypothetical protein